MGQDGKNLKEPKYQVTLEPAQWYMRKCLWRTRGSGGPQAGCLNYTLTRRLGRSILTPAFARSFIPPFPEVQERLVSPSPPPTLHLCPCSHPCHPRYPSCSNFPALPTSSRRPSDVTASLTVLTPQTAPSCGLFPTLHRFPWCREQIRLTPQI